MATVTHPSGGVKTQTTRQLDIPAVRLVTVVERTTELSGEVLKSVEEGERAAIEASGRFVVTVEEAVQQEVEGTFEVAKKITESGFETADQLVHTQYDFLRKVIDSTAESVSGRNGAKPDAAK